ncbi:MAG: RluA family pseudouridine synthase [Clostridia bacterium]|nr:RluA family pseudouridine synthase [Clostridia bacterium]
MDLNVVYEDNHIIVVVKPPNVPSQGDKTGDDDMLTIVKRYIKEKYNKPGDVYLGLVHRLDRPVGGIMIFARTSKAASRLSQQVRDKEFKKTYLVIVDGKMEEKSGVLEDYLIKDERTNLSRVAKAEEVGAKYAKLDYEVIKYDEGADLSLVKVNLHTGRHHQIRVQFSSRNHSIYADQKYGTRGKRKKIALWAYKLTITHPVTKEKMTFEAEPQGNIKRMLCEIV